MFSDVATTSCTKYDQLELLAEEDISLIKTLPTEILVRILSFLEKEDIRSARLVQKSWNFAVIYIEQGKQYKSYENSIRLLEDLMVEVINPSLQISLAENKEQSNIHTVLSIEFRTRGESLCHKLFKSKNLKEVKKLIENTKEEISLLLEKLSESDLLKLKGRVEKNIALQDFVGTVSKAYITQLYRRRRPGAYQGDF